VGTGVNFHRVLSRFPGHAHERSMEAANIKMRRARAVVTAPVRRKSRKTGESDTLSSFWETIKPPDRKRSEMIPDTPVDRASVLLWASELGQPGKSPIITIPGRSQEDVLEKLGERTTRALAGSNAPREFLRGLFRELMTASDLLIDDPLRALADREGSLPCRVFRLIWEGRFLSQESQSKFEGFLDRVVLWSTGAPGADLDPVPATTVEKMCIVCFLVTLGMQNGILNRVVILFDGVSLLDTRAAAKEFMDGLAEVRRWALTAGCPLGIMLGFTASKTDLAALRKLNQGLALEVETGLSWTKAGHV